MRLFHTLVTTCLAVGILSSPSEARPHRQHHHATHGSAWSGVPTLMRGGVAAGERQNDAADQEHLTRIQDAGQLETLIKEKRLVPVSNTDAYEIDPRMASGNALYAHARPRVRTFLDQELGAGHQKFHEKFLVTSLVRTREYQERLCRVNSAAICGKEHWRQSSHLTGSTVDISFYKDIRLTPLDPKAHDWLRERLLTLAKEGKVIVINEVGNGCFHVMVLPKYAETIAVHEARGKPVRHRAAAKSKAHLKKAPVHHRHHHRRTAHKKTQH